METLSVDNLSALISDDLHNRTICCPGLSLFSFFLIKATAKNDIENPTHQTRGIRRNLPEQKCSKLCADTTADEAYINILTQSNIHEERGAIIESSNNFYAHTSLKKEEEEVSQLQVLYDSIIVCISLYFVCIVLDIKLPKAAGSCRIDISTHQHSKLGYSTQGYSTQNVSSGRRLQKGDVAGDVYFQSFKLCSTARCRKGGRED